MMPVRLRLMMNQLRLPSLLAQCANSNMPIEVRRVRLCKSPSTALELTGTSSAPAPGAGIRRPGRRSPGPVRGTRPSDSPRRPAVQEQSSSPSQELGSDDVPVEIYAVIYIFNPPDREKFGMGAASAKNPAGPPAGVPPGSPLPAPRNKP